MSSSVLDAILTPRARLLLVTIACSHAGAYITDADWHDVYDRTQAVGVTKPVILEDNVWIGDGATVCKGVTIGAGRVVASDIPKNVIAAGNPAVVIKPLEADRKLVTRETLFQNPRELTANMEQIDRYVLSGNFWWGWLRVKLAPKRGD